MSSKTAPLRKLAKAVQQDLPSSSKLDSVESKKGMSESIPRKMSWTKEDFQQFREEAKDMPQDSSTEKSDTDSFMQESSTEKSDKESVMRKSVDPTHVKVQNGVAHLVARVGGVLIYVETQVGEIYAPARVWVLGNIAAAQEHLKDGLDPLTAQATNYLSPVVAKVDGACGSARAKAISVMSPLYAKVVDGVLYVQGTIGNTTIYIQARASQTWTVLVAKTSTSYAVAYQALDNRVQPGWVWASSHFASAKASILSTAQPYWTRARDGSLYIQAAIGNAIVRVKISMHDRIVGPALLAYTNAHGAISGYAAQMIAKIVSIYDQSKARLLQALAPYLEKGRSMTSYTKAVVNDVIVGVKVRAATKRDSAQASLSLCYVKFKNGFVYVQGLVGDKVVCVKVSFTELLGSVKGKALEIRAEAVARALIAREHVHDTASSVAQFAKCKASLVSSKVQVAVADKNVQVTTAGAVGGAATMAVGGGGAGLATGTVIGAACAVPMAFFTFGLSIPIGAALGGATGLCAGAVTGGAVGLVGGGATARSVHKHSDEIKGGAMSALNKASGCKDYMSMKAKGYTDSVVGTTMTVKSRLVGGTGGTTPDSD